MKSTRCFKNSRPFQMTLDNDLRYHAERIARKKHLSLSRFLTLALLDKLEQEESKLPHA